MVILAINPGSTSTKICLHCHGRRQEISLPVVCPSAPLLEQEQTRLQQIEQWLHEVGADFGKFDAVVGRGGLLKPVKAGTYGINDAMVRDCREGRRGHHPSNLGPILARRIGDQAGAPSYVVDPVSVDERCDLAIPTGYPEIRRDGLGHILSIRAAARRAAAELNKDPETCRFTAVHMGSGVSVAAVQGGTVLDINNANDEGPFSSERTGGLPFGAVLDLCYREGMDEAAALREVLQRGGLRGYLGTNDLQEAEAMESGDSIGIQQALAYQVAKEIGAYSIYLRGRIDAVILTGGMAKSEALVAGISGFVQWLAPILCYPGEEELEALTWGALRVLQGTEEPKSYGEVL